MKRIGLTITVTAYFYVLFTAFLFCFVPQVFAEEKSDTIKDEFQMLIQGSEYLKKEYKKYTGLEYSKRIYNIYKELIKAINESGMEPFYERILKDTAEYEIIVFHIIKNGEILVNAKIHYIKYNDGLFFKENEKSKLYDAQISFYQMKKPHMMTINLVDEETVISGTVIASTFVVLEVIFDETPSYKLYLKNENSFFIGNVEGIDVGGDGKLELLNIKMKEKTGGTEKETEIHFFDYDNNDLWDQITHTTCFEEVCVSGKMKE